MGEGDFKHMLIGFTFIAVFLFAILSFSVLMADDYGKESEQITGGALNLDPIEQHLEDIETDAQSQKQAFEGGSIWDIAGVVVTTVFGVAKNLFIMISLPFQFLNDIMVDILHIPTIIVGVIWGIIIISFIFAVWRLIKIGD